VLLLSRALLCRSARRRLAPPTLAATNTGVADCAIKNYCELSSGRIVWFRALPLALPPLAGYLMSVYVLVWQALVELRFPARRCACIFALLCVADNLYCGCATGPLSASRLSIFLRSLPQGPVHISLWYDLSRHVRTVADSVFFCRASKLCCRFEMVLCEPRGLCRPQPVCMRGG
jgi:hypothetical protein